MYCFRMSGGCFTMIIFTYRFVFSNRDRMFRFIEYFLFCSSYIMNSGSS